jgi:methylmalonyl-CoA mutase N-terminal domain/subunit
MTDWTSRRAAWERDRLGRALQRAPERRQRFSTISDVQVERLYGPWSVGEGGGGPTAVDRQGRRLRDGRGRWADFDPVRDVGLPGEPPFTRGIHPSGYRGRLWTMRMFAGFGSPADTNQRFKYLMAHGMTGLSTAFDMPALMGYDASHAMSRGEVGKEGVAISTLRDFEILFDGIPLDQVTTSMTINASAIVALCMYIAVAEKQGVPMEKLGGTIQNDMLKEYIAQKEWIVPPRPAVRIVVDMIDFCTRHMPRWHPVSISGYHIREAGATAVQELAFTLADGVAYVSELVGRGRLTVDLFAHRLSFFFDVHNDFFEEIAKLRAARRIWARHVKERYGARSPRSWMMRFHSQTAGVTLTAQQPMNNVVRVAYQALAAVLGGTQSLHTNSMDETLALPSEQAVQVALRTQQLLAFETGVPNVVDPLGGSYYLESLTNQLEQEAEAIFTEIERIGGVVRGLEQGWFQRKIAESAARQQWEIEQHRRVIVGVNEFVTDEPELTIPLLKVGEDADRSQRERLAKVRQERDDAACRQALDALRAAARGSDNTMPYILECARRYCTLYEIRAALESVFGAYREPVFF